MNISIIVYLYQESSLITVPECQLFQGGSAISQMNDQHPRRRSVGSTVSEKPQVG